VTDPVKTSWAASELTLTTPLLILQQPFQFRTEYANGQLRLLWSNPSPEFATRLAAKRHNETIWNILEEDIPSPQTEYLVPASGDVADYDFTVAAVNRLGAGPWSSVSTALLGARHPGAPAHPLKVGTTKRLDQIEIGWALPDDDGGMPIDKFKISVIRTSERPAGLPDPAIPLEDLPEPAMLIEVGQISEYVVVQLHPATSYSFRVAAHNGVGWSSLSEVSPPISTAALIAPESNYWVKRMKQALAICVTIFLVLALMCGGCIYFAYKQQEKEGTFDHQPNAWKEFKAMVDSEESKQRSVFKDDDLL
jgi:hypothetical protein